MKYRILTTRRSRWGEGWQYGDIVAIDTEAARVPLLLHEIEPVSEFVEPAVEANVDVPFGIDVPKSEERLFVCNICEKVCKNEFGLSVHKRSHQ